MSQLSHLKHGSSFAIKRYLREAAKSACSSVRHSSSSSQDPPKPEHPANRTLRLLGNDMKTVKSYFSNKEPTQTHDSEMFPTHCDVVVIGGGVMGSSIAYWLKQKAPRGISVTVVEKDPTVMSNFSLSEQYEQASTVLSVGGMRQQFSLKENIQMSMFGADFLRNIKQHLSVEGHDVPDVQFTPNGYLFLASENGVKQLEANYKLQLELGARNELLSPAKLKEKFPWLNTDGIALGCHGLENEGWFDPWSLLNGFKRKAASLGAEFVHGQAIGFEFRRQEDILMDGIEAGTYEGLDRVIVKTNTGEIKTIKFAIAVIAAGPQSGAVAKLARIGTHPGMLSIPLPVEPRKRFVYNFHCADGPGLNCPLTIDPNGVYFRREGLGGNYICGRSPEPDAEPSVDNLDVDYDFFDMHVWPYCAKRAPAFENIKLKSAWAGFYEYNTFDANGIVGPHPYYNNLYIATGFSGHGIQQAPAVGRAVMEMILDGDFQTIDLTRMGFDRLIVDRPLWEQNIV